MDFRSLDACAEVAYETHRCLTPDITVPWSALPETQRSRLRDQVLWVHIGHLQPEGLYVGEIPWSVLPAHLRMQYEILYDIIRQVCRVLDVCEWKGRVAEVPCSQEVVAVI